MKSMFTPASIGVLALLVMPAAIAANDTEKMAPIQVEASGLSDLISSPQSQLAQTTHALNAEFLETFQPAKTEEVLVYLPNVQAERLGAGIGEDYFVRGFSLGGRLLLDGVLDNQNYFVRDPATVEKVVVVKGHDSVLYGTGAPGGSLNFVSKRPQQQAATRLGLSVGSDAFRRLTLDSTGPLNKNAGVSYRTIAVWQDTDTWKNNVDDRQMTLMNSVQWDYAPSSYLLGTWEISQQHYPYDFDNVYANGKPVYDVSYVHPNTEATRLFHRVSLDWKHALKSGAWWSTQMHLFQGERDETQIGFFWLEADDEPLVGYYREVDESFQQLSLRSAWHQPYRLDGVDNEWVMGVERNHTYTDYLNWRTYGTFGLDIYQPSFDFALPTREQLSERDGLVEWNDRALFIQNTTRLSSELEMRLGLRYTDYDLLSARNEAVLGETERGDWSKSLGVSWTPQETLEWYASYSESFLPNTGQDRSGKLFDAQQGQQTELGVIYQPNESARLQLTAFHIRQNNLLTEDPIDPDYDVLAGEKSVTGLELQALWSVQNNLSVALQAGLLDAELSKNNDGYQGNIFPSVPEQTASLLLNYQPNLAWDATLGAVHQGKRAGDLANSFFVKGYTRYDAALAWKINPDWRTRLSVQNLTDEDYITYATAVDFLRFGPPRTWRLQVEKAL